MLAIARAGVAAGCQEALFTLGDKPELQYEAARRALARLGYRTTIEYLAAMCALVLRETGLLPHVNPGVMSEAEIAALRRVSVSQGMMLENASPRLGAARRAAPRLARQGAGGCGSRRSTAAGRLKVPFTTGILIGIGETRARAHRLAAGDRGAASRATATSRKSSSRISAPSRTPAWRARRSRTPTTCCGPSAWRGSCSGRR